MDTRRAPVMIIRIPPDLPCAMKTKTRARGPRFQFKSSEALSAVRADLRPGHHGRQRHHGRHRDRRRTPASASSAAGLRAAASCGQLARAAHGFGLFTGLLLGGLFVVSAELHLAENPSRCIFFFSALRA